MKATCILQFHKNILWRHLYLATCRHLVANSKPLFRFPTAVMGDRSRAGEEWIGQLGYSPRTEEKREADLDQRNSSWRSSYVMSSFNTSFLKCSQFSTFRRYESTKQLVKPNCAKCGTSWYKINFLSNPHLQSACRKRMNTLKIHCKKSIKYVIQLWLFRNTIPFINY